MEQKDIYESCVSRISSLNRTIFNYRILFLMVIAGAFTGFNFILDMAQGQSLFLYPEFLTLVLYFLISSTLFFTIVISLFDFTHQELIENCVQSMVAIERSKEFDRRARIVEREGRRQNAFRLNSSIVAFYFFPITMLFLVSVGMAAICSADYPFIGLPEYAQQSCQVIFPSISNINQNYTDLIGRCVSDFTSHTYTEDFIHLSTLVLFVNFAMAGIFYVYSLQRVWAYGYVYWKMKRFPYHGYFKFLTPLFICVCILTFAIISSVDGLTLWIDGVLFGSNESA